MWLFAAIAASVLWSLVNLVDNYLIREVYSGPKFGTIISGLFGLIFLPAIFIAGVEPVFDQYTLLVAAAGSSFIISWYYYFVALDREDAAVVASYYNLSLLIIPLISSIILGEVFKGHELLGAAILVFATIAITIVEVKGLKSVIFSPVKRAMLLMALLYSAGILMADTAYAAREFWSLFPALIVGMALTTVPFIIAMRQDSKASNFTQELKNNGFKLAVILLLIELINALALLFENIALNEGSASLTVIVEGSQPLFVVLLALLIFPFYPKVLTNEMKKRRIYKVVMMILMLVGIYFINNG